MVYLRIQDVVNKTTLCKSNIWDMCKDEEGDFPRPFALSSRILVWDSREIEIWMQSQKENARKNPNLRKNLISKKEKKEKMKK